MPLRNLYIYASKVIKMSIVALFAIVSKNGSNQVPNRQQSEQVNYGIFTQWNKIQQWKWKYSTTYSDKCNIEQK